jgi:hypothetical protein
VSGGTPDGGVSGSAATVQREEIVPAEPRRPRATEMPAERFREMRGRLRLGDAPIRGSPGNGASLHSWGERSAVAASHPPAAKRPWLLLASLSILVSSTILVASGLICTTPADPLSGIGRTPFANRSFVSFADSRSEERRAHAADLVRTATLFAHQNLLCSGTRDVMGLHMLEAYSARTTACENITVAFSG